MTDHAHHYDGRGLYETRVRIEQAVGKLKRQIWIAVSIYVLVAIVKKRLVLDASLYTLLQIFSVTLFEKVPMSQAFLKTEKQNHIRT